MIALRWGLLMQNIEKYIENYLNGDPSAMDALLQCFSKKVWFLVLRKIPAQDAEDLYQDICLDIFEGVSRLRERSKFMAWVFALTRRKIHEFYRSREGEPLAQSEQLLPETLVWEGMVPQEKVMRMKRIQNCIEGLSEPYRETAMYHFLLGLPYSEVAMVMGCNENTAKARINRAKTMIFNCVQRATV